MAALFPLDAPVLQALLDIIPGTLHVKDRDLRYCVVNRYYLQRWQLSAEDMIGKRSTELFGDEFDLAVEARDREVLETGESLPYYEVEYPTGDGGQIALWATKVPLFGDDGRPSHVLTLAFDITPLKRAQRALGESELTRVAMVERALDAIIAVDENGTIVEFNPAAEQVFGHRRDDVLGRAVDEILIPRRHRAAHASAMNRLRPGDLAARGGRRFETQGVHADGTEFPIEIAVAEIPLAGRSLFTAYVKDLTEQKAVEAELDRQRDALYQSSKLSAMGTLIAGISHELKNPLSVVVGQAMLMRETVDDEKVAARAERIGNAAERCAKIVRNFLDLARQRRRAIVSVSLDDVVDSALELTGHLLRANGIELELRRELSLPVVDGDRHQLGQVAINLIVNAQQAMSDAAGPRRMTIETRHDRESGDVCLEVSDTGPGLTEDVAANLFTPFYTTKDEGEGTGLGLAICSDIVASHGGRITADGAPGSGARFVVALPLARAGADAGAGGPDPAVTGSSARILIVDDEPEVLGTLHEVLRIGGYDVEAVASGEAALAAFAEGRFDAMLSDMRMPGMNGIELFDAVVASHPEMAERVAFITGDLLSGGARDFLARTGARCLEKPFTPKGVLALVESLLE